MTGRGPPWLMEGYSSTEEGPSSAEPLREPLLREEAIEVQVWEHSREWAELGDSSADGSTSHHALGRGERRRSGAGSSEVAGLGADDDRGSPLWLDSRVRGCLVNCFFFAEHALLAVCVVLSMSVQDWVAVGFLGPPWVLLVAFEVWLAFNDRTVTGAIQKLRRHSAYGRLLVFELFVVLVLGCFFCYLLHRARRHWLRKGQRTFVAELETLGSTKQQGEATRLDTLMMFLTSGPAVVGLTWVFIADARVCTPLAALVLPLSWALCSADLLIAITEYDYSVSGHVRHHYGMEFDGEDWFHLGQRYSRRFQWMHWSSRLAELLGRLLVLIAGAIASSRYPSWVAMAAAVDLSFGVVALLCTSGPSTKVALMCVPLFLLDLACYVDEPGFCAHAQRLSRWCSRFHAGQIVIAFAVYVACAHGHFPQASKPAWGVKFPLFMGYAMVGLYAAHFYARSSTAPPAPPTDLFGSPSVSPPDLQDLQALFGQEIGIGSVPRKQRKLLVSFMFWAGFGEQLEHLREQVHSRFSGAQVSLHNLKTLGPLGAGGFGKVFKVKDVGSGTIYALKLQPKDKAAKCAIREAQALHQSEHAFIVRLIHVFQTKELYGILMEYCDTDLNRCILGCLSADGRADGLPETRAARYSICMMLALEHLHGKGIIFRDLKPENVLLTAEDDYAKLADFGLARPLDQRPLGAPSGDVSPIFISPGAGTPAFMAREAFQQTPQQMDIDESPVAMGSAGGAQEEYTGGPGLPWWLAGRDWYALGCCLLLMLLGEHGGRRASAGGRREVLLPPPAAEIPAVLRRAARARRLTAEAFYLVAALTAPEVTERAGSAEMRRCPWLAEGVLLADLEAVAAEGARCVEARRSSAGSVGSVASDADPGRTPGNTPAHAGAG